MKLLLILPDDTDTDRVWHLCTKIRLLTGKILWCLSYLEALVHLRNIDRGNILMDTTLEYIGHLPRLRRLQFRFSHHRTMSNVHFFPSNVWTHFPNLDMPRQVIGTVGPDQNFPIQSVMTLSMYGLSLMSSTNSSLMYVWPYVLSYLLLAFHQKCNGIKFLEPLVANMQKEDLPERLSAEENRSVE
jgi:hypothetical protein